MTSLIVPTIRRTEGDGRSIRASTRLPGQILQDRTIRLGEGERGKLRRRHPPETRPRRGIVPRPFGRAVVEVHLDPGVRITMPDDPAQGPDPDLDPGLLA